MDTCKGVSTLKIEELEMSTENIKERSQHSFVEEMEEESG
jgi:hypothetical protein